MANSYPVSAPLHEESIPLDGVYTLHYREYGNPDGIPIVYLHGGPGSGASPESSRFFDPTAFRIIMYDQRREDIVDNTPERLVEDLEKLRRHLGIDKWHLLGGSWGAVPGLMYTQEHREHVLSQTYWGPFTFQPAEIDWIIKGSGALFPQAQAAFENFLPATERADILRAYFNRLADPDPNIHMPAAQAWRNHEMSRDLLRAPTPEELAAPATENDWLNARCEAHYFLNNILMPPDRILQNMGRIAGVPTLLIEGDKDVVCPPATARAIKQVLPSAWLQMVDAGHRSSEPAITAALIEATNRIRDTGSPLPPRERWQPLPQP